MKRWFIISIPMLIAVSILIDILFPVAEGHGDFFWDHVPGFFSLFGLLGCLCLIYFAKYIGSRFLQRKDDYYE